MNFDIARHERRGKPRDFTIADQTFTFKPSVGADLLADYYDTLADPDQPGFNRAVLAAADTLVLGWLEPGQEEQWRNVRSADNPDALTIRDIQEVIAHMTGVITGRDPEPRSGSSSTPSQPGTTSTEPSASPAAA